MSQQEINPIEDWANEELSEAELDALAGGQSFGDLQPIENFFSGDIAIVKNTDSSYTSFFGTTGTGSGGYNLGIPLNLTNAFP